MKHTVLPQQFLVRLTAASVFAAAVLTQPTLARAEPPNESARAAREGKAAATRPHIADICRALALSAISNGLPEEFFTRLIWQESRFDAAAISPAGAQGIAQFMPGTAAERGLIDAFRPLHALRESASYLRELRTTFRGNLGLAAAAYNAGPGQVEAWLSGRRRLPDETQAYVGIVTGYPVEAWTGQPPLPLLPSSNTRTGARCVELVKLMIANPRRALTPASRAWAPWGVQLAGNWSEERVRATYEQLRRKFHAILGDRQPLILNVGRRGPSTFIVRVSEKSREDADALCAKLQAAGGACAVLRNPPPG